MNDKIKVELNRDIRLVEVKEINGFLAKIHFTEENRFEWIFLGSPRIYKVHRHYISSRAFDKLIKFKTYKPCLSPYDDIVKIDSIEAIDEIQPEYTDASPTASMNVNKLKNHACSLHCINKEDEKNKNLEGYNALQCPLMTGWNRLLKNKVIGA